MPKGHFWTEAEANFIRNSVIHIRKIFNLNSFQIVLLVKSMSLILCSHAFPTDGLSPAYDSRVTVEGTVGNFSHVAPAALSLQFTLILKNPSLFSFRK